MFFFFQAEDGIRDKLVTGVQTCALPISRAKTSRFTRSFQRSKAVPAGLKIRKPSRASSVCGPRSEERRVGKSVDLGGRRIIKKKKKRTNREDRSQEQKEMHRNGD